MRARSAARIRRCPRTATMTRSTETSSARAARRRRFFIARACPARVRGSRSQFVILIISCNGSEKTRRTCWSLWLRVTLVVGRLEPVVAQFVGDDLVGFLLLGGRRARNRLGAFLGLSRTGRFLLVAVSLVGHVQLLRHAQGCMFHSL